MAKKTNTSPGHPHSWVDKNQQVLLQIAGEIVDEYWRESKRLKSEAVAENAWIRLAPRARLVSGSLQIDWLETRPNFAAKKSADTKPFMRPIPKGQGTKY
jgi:hypothetical protein